jgi:hypothetical protein
MNDHARIIGRGEIGLGRAYKVAGRTGLLALITGLLLAVSGAAAASSQVASGTTRYASPTGGSTGACSRPDPCEIGTAFEVAQSGDTVIILAGKYGSASTPVPDFVVNDGEKLTIRGEAGKPAPVIYTGQGTRIDAPAGSTLSHLDIRHQGASTAFYVGSGAVVDHVAVIDAPESDQACEIFDGTMVDSSCFAQGQDAVAINADDLDGSPSTIGLIGVDAIASGEGGIAVHGQATYSSALTLNIADTIMEGGEADLYVGASDSVDTSIANTDHSAYRTLETDPSGDGSEAIHPTNDISKRPDLKDVLGGDFRELPDSATIDAGTPKSAPPTDLAGNQRTAGRTTDIGAYEFQPAPALTHPNATAALRAIRASVRVNPGRLKTTVRLIAVRGGHTIRSTPKSAGAGKSDKRVTLMLRGLKGRTTYRVYIRATNSGGSNSTKHVRIRTAR